MEPPHLKHKPLGGLTTSAADFIKLIIKRMRYRKKTRDEVMAELAYHFEDELKDCKTEQDKSDKALRLIEEFGDPKLLAILLRRAKKRCRPLWRTIVARAFQAACVLVLCFVLYAASFLAAKPNPKVDYVKVFNDMARPEITEKDNAWPHYKKAVEAYVEPDREQLPKGILNFNHNSLYTSFADLSESEQKAIRSWVRQNQPALNHFLAASQKPYCFTEYRVSDQTKNNWTMHIRLPQLNSLKGVARVGIWNSRMQRERGNNIEALQTCLAVVRASKHWQLRLMLIEQLVAVGISNLGNYEILRILETETFQADELFRLQNELRNIYPHGFPLMNIEPEKFFFRDTVQQVFTDGGIGGGHLIPDRLPLLMPLAYGAYEGESKFVYLSLSLIHARRKDTLERADQLYDQMIEISRMTPYSRRVTGRNAEELVDALPEHRFRLCRIFIPAVDRASEFSYLTKALHEATLTVIALKRWRLEKDGYPDNLVQLIDTGYLPELPMDPYSDKSLVYRNNADDFVLYSVGPDLIDDGGKPGSNERGRKRMWVEDADTVFWPVQTTEQYELRRSEANRSGMDAAEKTSKHKAAAPLNHNVRIERTGRVLKLNYELIGTDGRKYDLWGIRDKSKPTFVVNRNKVTVGTGTFEYG